MWKNRIVLICFIVGSTVFVSYYGGPVPYMLFTFFWSLPLISFLYTLYVYFRFTFIQKVEQTKIVKGEPFPFYFQLCNEDFVSYTAIRVCFFSDRSEVLSFDETTEFCLLPGEKREVVTELVCKYRGEYHTGIRSVVITDFLNIMRIKYPVMSKFQVTVLPRKISIKDQPILVTDEDEKKAGKQFAGEEVADARVHPYVKGESLKRVHWKASARTGELMTRQYHSEQKKQIVVCMDLSKTDGAELERARIEDGVIEEALAIANYSLDEKIPCLFLHNSIQSHASSCAGIQAVPLGTEDELTQLYLWGANVPFENEGCIVDSMMDFMAQSHREISENAQMIFVLHEIKEKSFEKLCEMTLMGRSLEVVLITCGLSKEEEAWKNAFMKHGINVYTRILQNGENHNL